MLRQFIRPLARRVKSSTQEFAGSHIDVLLSFYPPYLGAGVVVKEPAPNTFVVEMKLKATNRNYVGTHFGGSLYSMCDPFFMLIAMRELGHDFIVWDKAATIRFRKPGRGRVRATFAIPPERLDAIRTEATKDGRSQPTFIATVIDDKGDIVCEVEKTLSVRLKAAA